MIREGDRLLVGLSGGKERFLNRDFLQPAVRGAFGTALTWLKEFHQGFGEVWMKLMIVDCFVSPLH